MSAFLLQLLSYRSPFNTLLCALLYTSVCTSIWAQTNDTAAPPRRWRVQMQERLTPSNAANTSNLANLTANTHEKPQLYIQEPLHIPPSTPIVETSLNLPDRKSDAKTDAKTDSSTVYYSARTWRTVRHQNSLSPSSQNAEISQNATLPPVTSSATSSTSSNSERSHEATSRLAYSLRNFNQQPLDLPLKAPRLEVDKSRRNLVVLDGETEVRRYGIDLGREPQLPKERRGDGRTPEGFYYICTKNDRSQFNLSMGISYPNIEDAQKGMQRGLITRTQFRAIENAIFNQKLPPQNTRLGGAIMIHGETRYNGDWTEGCIGLRNEDMQELFSIIPVGAPLYINW